MANAIEHNDDSRAFGVASDKDASHKMLKAEIGVPSIGKHPDLDSSHLFVPGLIGVILQLVTLFLTSFAVVRERELGTLEQLFVTPEPA